MYYLAFSKSLFSETKVSLQSAFIESRMPDNRDYVT